MSNQCTRCIRIGLILVMGLGFITSNWMGATLSQANSSQNPVVQEEKPFDQVQALADLRKRIAGKEDKSSEEVFINIQIPAYKKLPAKFLLGAMEFWFSKSLGVDCRHCHVVGQWEKDDKPTKPIARDMYEMMLSIDNNLAKIRNLRSAKPLVSCYTCHRGQTKPEITLPESKGKQ